MDLHEKVFAPEYSIQGEDIPLNITWDKSKPIEVNISFSENILIKEIYNIDNSGLSVNGNSINITKFETNGYLGLALETKSQNESMIDEKIIIRITYNGEEKIINKIVKLFRPDVKLVHKPEEITIIKDGDKLNIQNRIVIKNYGNGTGLIELNDKENSELKLTEPGVLQEFIIKVISEFIERLGKLKNMLNPLNLILEIDQKIYLVNLSIS
jgi:hypothetical protein